jgi:SAM-dependent methyltransferase
MRSSFPLFQSHLDLAHTYWAQIVQMGDTVIDATCGNGHDTLKLCQLALSFDKGKVYALDIQEQAIKSAHQFIQSYLESSLAQHVIFQQRCHSIFPDDISPASVKLVVYNLGYLPGGNKAKTTEMETTLQSLRQAQDLLLPGGVISITCYSGHAEGAKEQEGVLAYASQLPPKEWSCCQHIWLNRQHAPSLLLIQKAK